MLMIRTLRGEGESLSAGREKERALSHFYGGKSTTSKKKGACRPLLQLSCEKRDRERERRSQKANQREGYMDKVVLKRLD